MPGRAPQVNKEPQKPAEERPSQEQKRQATSRNTKAREKRQEDRTLRLESRKRGRRNCRMRHRQKWRGSGERRNTYRSLRQNLCRTQRIQPPHPNETPEEGRTEVQ